MELALTVCEVPQLYKIKIAITISVQYLLNYAIQENAKLKHEFRSRKVLLTPF